MQSNVEGRDGAQLLSQESGRKNHPQIIMAVKRHVDEGESEEVSSNKSMTLMDIQVSKNDATSDHSGMISSITLNDISNPCCRDGDNSSRSFSFRQVNHYPRFLNQGQDDSKGGFENSRRRATFERSAGNIVDAILGGCSSIASEEDSFGRTASHGAASLLDDFYNDEGSTRMMGCGWNRGNGGQKTSYVRSKGSDGGGDDSHNSENPPFDANKAEVFSWNGDSSLFSSRAMSDGCEDFGDDYNIQLNCDAGEDEDSDVKAETSCQSHPTQKKFAIDMQNGQCIKRSSTDCTPRDSLEPISEYRRSSTKSYIEAESSSVETGKKATESQGGLPDRRVSRGLSLMDRDRKEILSSQNDTLFDGDRGGFLSWDDSIRTFNARNKELSLEDAGMSSLTRGIDRRKGNGGQKNDKVG